jgi:hypothetical protein
LLNVSLFRFLDPAARSQDSVAEVGGEQSLMKRLSAIKTTGLSEHEKLRRSC